MASDLADVAIAHQIGTHQCRMLRIFQITDVLIFAELVLPGALGVGVRSRSTILAVGGLEHEHVSRLGVSVRRHLVLVPIVFCKVLACRHGNMVMVKPFDDISSGTAD